MIGLGSLSMKFKIFSNFLLLQEFEFSSLKKSEKTRTSKVERLGVNLSLIQSFHFFSFSFATSMSFCAEKILSKNVQNFPPS